MKVPGIPGDSKDPEHLNWIELISVQTAPASPAARGEKPQTGINFSKMPDGSSTNLMDAAAKGRIFPEVIIEQTSDESVLKQTFTSVVFSAFSTGKTPEDGESGSFDAQGVSFESRSRRRDGTPGQPAPNQPEPSREPQPGAASKGTGPVGSGEHVVRDGECILSIAQDHGHLFDTIWNHPNNAQLQSIRKDPNILLDGDRVHIPARQKKQEACQTAMLHTFRKKGAAKLILRLVEEPEQQQQQQQEPDPPVNRGPKGRDFITEDPEPQSQRVDDVPRTNVPFKLEIGQFTFNGATDGEGKITMNIPPNAKGGKLTLEPGTPNEFIMPVRLGRLDPITENSGVKQRLTNLGFACDDGSQEFTPALKFAVEAFQQKAGLEITRKIDEQTRDKLKELHGC